MGKEKSKATDDDQSRENTVDSKPVDYVIAPGKAISGTLKGIISEGSSVRPEYFRTNGDEVMKDLVKRGDAITKDEYEKLMKVKESEEK